MGPSQFPKSYGLWGSIHFQLFDSTLLHGSCVHFHPQMNICAPFSNPGATKSGSVLSLRGAQEPQGAAGIVLGGRRPPLTPAPLCVVTTPASRAACRAGRRPPDGGGGGAALPGDGGGGGGGRPAPRRPVDPRPRGPDPHARGRGREGGGGRGGMEAGIVAGVPSPGTRPDAIPGGAELRGRAHARGGICHEVCGPSLCDPWSLARGQILRALGLV